MGNPERIVHIGDSGAGQICKACNQLVIGGTLAAVGEAFALARKAGVDPSKVRAALLGGFAASRVLEVHGERLLKDNFKPGFPARLYRKDLGIVLDALTESRTPAPVTAVVQQLLSALLAQQKDRSRLLGARNCPVRSGARREACVLSVLSPSMCSTAACRAARRRSRPTGDAVDGV